MRVPKKREITALWLLYKKGGEINLGEAIDLLRTELCVTKRTASNIIKRLRKLKLLEVKIYPNEIRIKAIDPLSIFESIALEYLKYRKTRCKGRN